MKSLGSKSMDFVLRAIGRGDVEAARLSGPARTSAGELTAVLPRIPSRIGGCSRDAHGRRYVTAGIRDFCGQLEVDDDHRET